MRVPPPGAVCICLAAFPFSACSLQLPPHPAPCHEASAAHPEIKDVADLPAFRRRNAAQIFNAIHSSLRQWGSSLNHNGMSFFVAHMPPGTELYHGRGDNESVTGLEWLAFEPEHALNFAWKVERGPPGGPPGGPPHDHEPDDDRPKLSTKWLLHSDPSFLFPDPRDHQSRSRDHAGPQHPLLDKQPPSSSPKPPRFKAKPGYLHTYRTAHPLNLLYLDGQSAAKSDKGTLDSQDEILRIHESGKGNSSTMFDEFNRAAYLCRDLASERWEDRIQGFLRMEHGFEIIMCNFERDLETVSIGRAHAEDYDSGFPAPSNGLENLGFWKAIGARYRDIGSQGLAGGRAFIDYSRMVTGWDFADAEDLIDGDNERDERQFPRLKNLPTVAKEELFEAVSNMVMSIPPVPAPPHPDNPRHRPHHPPPPPLPHLHLPHLSEPDPSLKDDSEDFPLNGKRKPEKHVENRKGEKDRLRRPRPDVPRSPKHRGITPTFPNKRVHHDLPERPDCPEYGNLPDRPDQPNPANPHWPPPHGPPFHGPPPHSHLRHPHHRTPNWQSVADMLIQRYSDRIHVLAHSESMTTKSDLDTETLLLLRPFIDFDNRNETAELQRCTYHFLPAIPRSHFGFHESLASSAVIAVSHQICSTFLSAIAIPNPKTSIPTAATLLGVDSQSDEANTFNKTRALYIRLVDTLQWTSWKDCRPGCQYHEVCFTAIWPFGTYEDLIRPSCKNGTELQERGRGRDGERERSYWNMGPRR